MFDIGFWEIILIGVVALLVVGPDKFPGLIRDVARWAVKLRRFVMDTKREIEREIKFDDIEKELKAGAKGLDYKPTPTPETKPDAAERDQNVVDKQSAA
ncbi:MAG: twin-arginine translocation protein, TatB subunit [Gammaproteobacteria bacterium]|nr:twin-arginine translocation protein, TatB subunit [Gammaproteobacteria bacterium]